MTDSQNWRTEVTGEDYFRHQKKQVQLADRRPVIRKPSDLVGPGIAANAIRLADFNDTLATYDGFFSADVGAAHPPNTSDAFIGTVVSDSTLGGVQTFTGLTSGNAYQRTFLRNPSDAATIYWGAWELIGSGTGGGGTFLETLPASIIDAKGDLIVGQADNAPARLGVGADGDSLVANPAAAGGLGYDTRVKNVVAGDYIVVDDTDPLNPIVSSFGSSNFRNTDHTVATTAGTVSLLLTQIPRDGSLHVKWDGSDLDPTEYTMSGQVVTFTDPHIHVGDKLSASYAYLPAVNAFDLALRGTTRNTDALPTEAVLGDFTVIAARWGFGTAINITDPRFTLVSSSPGGRGGVWVGNLTDLGALVYTGSVSKIAIATYIGPAVVQASSAAVSTSAPTPAAPAPLAGTAAIGVLGERSSVVPGGLGAQGAPWVLDQNTGDAQFVAARIYHWIDDAASTTPSFSATWGTGGLDEVDAVLLTVGPIG